MDPWPEHPHRTPGVSRSMPVLRQVAQLGHPVLRTMAAPVELPAAAALRSLIDDMLATLREADGVGIAAPRSTNPSSLFIVASRPNPRIPMPLDGAGGRDQPGDRGSVRRDGQGLGGMPEHPGDPRRGPAPSPDPGPVPDRRGRAVEREFSDFVARIFQHEDDHLRGIVFLDRLESMRDVITEREYQKAMAKPKRPELSPGAGRCSLGTAIAWLCLRVRTA